MALPKNSRASGGGGPRFAISRPPIGAPECPPCACARWIRRDDRRDRGGVERPHRTRRVERVPGLCRSRRAIDREISRSRRGPSPCWPRRAHSAARRGDSAPSPARKMDALETSHAKKTKRAARSRVNRRSFSPVNLKRSAFARKSVWGPRSQREAAHARGHGLTTLIGDVVCFFSHLAFRRRRRSVFTSTSCRDPWPPRIPG